MLAITATVRSTRGSERSPEKDGDLRSGSTDTLAIGVTSPLEECRQSTRTGDNMSNYGRHLPAPGADYRRLRRAAFAPSFPNAVRTRWGKCATVRFSFAARAAFLMFRRAALRCRGDAIRVSDRWGAAESAAAVPVRRAPARADWAAQGSLAYPASSQEDVP